MRECVYQGCSNKRSTATLKHKSFHSIPELDVELRKLWLTALKIDGEPSVEQTKNWRVCSDHFEAEDFYPKEPEQDITPPKKRAGLRKSKQKRNPKKERTRIRPHAVPRTATGLKAL